MSESEDNNRGTASEDADWGVIEQRAYDPESDQDLTTVVIEAVAAAEDEPVASIKEPLLYEVVDIAAVNDALFGTKLTDTKGVTGGSLDFEYRGFRITVRGDGWVQVAEPTEE
ncbi:HalOD1 output domain-containing protein [Halorarius halobius]|uniref:HalOD1 output domain-containing protein n=1 Tax=Halorarius halobius TaxID=2962671 RepID=UPI0020CDBBC9|nr:HalOD1 output domain-containing protein [Halorarius halobius]